MLRPRLRLSALACLAATAAALTTLRPLNRGSLGRGDSGARPLNRGSLIGRDQRSATPLARLHALAAAGWIAQVDDSGGQTYYVNSQTGEAQWEEPPQSMAGNAQWQWRIDGVSGVAGFSGVDGFAAFDKYYAKRMTSAQKKGACRLEHGREGRPCQLPYRVSAGEERPLSRYNMVEQKAYVAKKQCMVRCAADGTGILASEGKSPTLWRAAGGPWNSLYQGEEQLLSEGDEISLDCYHPEEAVFVCYFGEAVGGDAAGGQQQQQQQQQGGPGAGWIAQVDNSSGQMYYMNSQTGEAQWEEPPPPQ